MPQQIKRLLVVFALIIAGFMTARHFLVPPTFGVLGHYRAASIDSIAALPIRYAGQRACNECHDDVVAEKANSRHAGVACEVCHGAAAKHAEIRTAACLRHPETAASAPCATGTTPRDPPASRRSIPRPTILPSPASPATNPTSR